MLTSSYENPESRIEDYFRIKYAGSSNYRGATFWPLAKSSQILSAYVKTTADKNLRQVRRFKFSNVRNNNPLQCRGLTITPDKDIRGQAGIISRGKAGKLSMSTLTKVNICFSLSVPTILVRNAVWIVLLYRRVNYGYTFRRIKLTRGKYAIVNVEDFEWLNQYKWHCSYQGYAKRAVYKRAGKGRRQVEVYMHKLLCPVPDGMIVDHINRNSLDNRRENLRAATQKQNVWNRKFIRKRGKTRYNGIRWDRNREKWQVRLTVNGRRKSFGYYTDEIEAAKEYDRVAKKYRGEYACLNFPQK